MDITYLRLDLALIGFFALLAVLLLALKISKRDRKATAVAVAAGGAVTVAVTGLFFLLHALGQAA